MNKEFDYNAISSLFESETSFELISELISDMDLEFRGVSLA